MGAESCFFAPLPTALGYILTNTDMAFATWGRCYYSLRFTDEEPKAQRG